MSEQDTTRRSFLAATGGAASAVALGSGLAGASAGQETTTEGGEQGTQTGQGQGQRSGGTLNLINSTMSTLDPIKATDTASGEVIQQVFDALMNYPDGNIEVQPLLAKNYEVSDDFTTYTFTIREGATFHDGSPVTAQDFVYSFERLAQSDNSRRSYFILQSIGVKHSTDADGNYQPDTLGVTAQNDRTLQIQLQEPFHATLEMLAYTSFAAVPEGIVGDINGYDGELNYQEFSTSAPVGCGPFEFEKWESNTEAAVTRFDNYYGKKAEVDRVHWRIMSDANARYTYAMNKNADAFSIPTQFYNPNKVNVTKTDNRGRKVGTYGPVRNGETLNFLAVPTINTFYIGFNTNQVEAAARKAAAYAMNKEQLVEQVFKGRGRPAYHFTPPAIYPGGNDAYQKHAQQEYPYSYRQTDLQKARQVMKEAGYGPNNRYSFTFTVYQRSNTWPQVGQLLRDKLSSAYIDMNIETAPFSTLLQRGREGNLQAYSLGWVMDWPAPDNFLQLLNPPLTDTSQSAPISYVNWSGTEASQRARQAWTTVQNNPAPTDKAERLRNQAYIEMEEANWQDCVFLNVYHETDQRFWYDYAQIPKFGAAGTSRQMFNGVTLNEPNAGGGSN
ncbi:ABC transporter substrate-binding protein [Halorussus gelatinilyticus]|uniref:ABC transporter substrate-binding protein n=1 Tax=Halorussus gelatinilyticus TaxID=2937524 RepID=A0A8U0ID37_9EURY|nr:ABC transporter substrate-binding protein [Halorussus gelatinilyticus]UPV98862.1 ABC transporter substrate-binding protein [Halorussus gelatinilyticus]